jgi:hypothetical protein
MKYLEKVVVRRGHPRNVIVGLVGFLWVVFLVWRHEWAWALVVVFVSAILGRAATIGTHEESLGQTLLGKMALLHLHPMNVVVQLAGFGVLLYALWMHELMFILVGISLVLLGHMWGWHRVSEAL